MNAEFFVDTNIFLYSIDDSAESKSKREVARQILQTQPWGNSQESLLTRKMRSAFLLIVS